jgi:hypothetical protein
VGRSAAGFLPGGRKEGLCGFSPCDSFPFRDCSGARVWGTRREFVAYTQAICSELPISFELLAVAAGSQGACSGFVLVRFVTRAGWICFGIFAASTC